jgi:hypothetical protein
MRATIKRWAILIWTSGISEFQFHLISSSNTVTSVASRHERRTRERMLVVRSTSRTQKPSGTRWTEHVGPKGTQRAPQPVFIGDNRWELKRSFSGRSVRLLSYPAHCQKLTTKMLSFQSVFACGARNEWSLSQHFTDYSNFTVIFQQNLYLNCVVVGNESRR